MSLAATLLGVGFAVPAQAASYRYNPPGNSLSWTTFHEICYTGGCDAHSGTAVRLWQSILCADYLSELGESCSSFVDGQFGANTHNWTKRWQDDRNLDDDGWVGPDTWSRARQNLRDWFNGGSGCGCYYFKYDGSQRDFRVIQWGLTFEWSFETCVWV